MDHSGIQIWRHVAHREKDYSSSIIAGTPASVSRIDGVKVSSFPAGRLLVVLSSARKENGRFDRSLWICRTDADGCVRIFAVDKPVHVLFSVSENDKIRTLVSVLRLFVSKHGRRIEEIDIEMLSSCLQLRLTPHHILQRLL